jgi:hypothetical protein
LLNLPTDSKNQESNLDCVELIDDWVELRILDVEDVLVNINQVVHLGD